MIVRCPLLAGCQPQLAGHAEDRSLLSMKLKEDRRKILILNELLKCQVLKEMELHRFQCYAAHLFVWSRLMKNNHSIVWVASRCCFFLVGTDQWVIMGPLQWCHRSGGFGNMSAWLSPCWKSRESLARLIDLGGDAAQHCFFWCWDVEVVQACKDLLHTDHPELYWFYSNYVSLLFAAHCFL